MLGIICNYYVRNYGSVLQSLALQRTLDKFDVDNEIIQYVERIPKKKRLEIFLKLQIKKLFRSDIVKEKLCSKMDTKKDEQYLRVVQERNQVFEEFVEGNFKFSSCFETMEQVQENAKNYDGIILGSDQLWCPSDLLLGYHTLEWLERDIYKASYATSFGVSVLPTFLEKKLKQFLRNFNRVSVREQSGVDMIRKNCECNVELVLDPTLLLSKDEWDVVLPYEKSADEKYIFCYFLSNAEELKKRANILQQRTGLQIVTIPHLESYDRSEQNFGDVKLWKLNPCDMINLIRHAEYVLTDSFHVSIFSILYEKKFLVFDRYARGNADSRNTRIDNLLSITGLHERYYNGNGDDIETAINANIDYAMAKERIECEKKKSLKYIEDILQEVK